MSSLLKDLCLAAKDNDFDSEAAKAILEAHPDVLKPDPNPDTPEGEVAPYKDISCGESPLLRAVDENHLEMVRLLLEHGADPDEHHGWNYGMPLQKAILKGCSNVAHLLLDYEQE